MEQKTEEKIQTTNIKNETKISFKTILTKIFTFIIIILILAFAKTGAKFITHYIKTEIQNTKKENHEQKKLIEDIAFIKTIETLNTTALKNYCSKTGFEPTDYIEKIQKKFFKTFLKGNELFYIYIPKELRKSSEKEIYDVCIKKIEEDFKTTSLENKISKKEYCKIINKRRDLLIEEQINYFKKQKPHLYID